MPNEKQTETEEKAAVDLSRIVRPLPCPHCGSSAELHFCQHDRSRVYYACIENACHYTYTDPIDALKAWNRRANVKVSDCPPNH